MEFLSTFFTDFVGQLQSPTLGFLIVGIVIAAFGSQLVIPDAINKFIVFMLLMRIGLDAGMEIRGATPQLIANPLLFIAPSLFASIIGILIVLISRYTLGKLPGVKVEDALATGGLFGAVSGSTLAAVLEALETRNVQFEEWAGALYPFMDIPALVTAIVVASAYIKNREAKMTQRNLVSEYPNTPVEYDPKKGRIVAAGYPKTNRSIEIWPIVKDSIQGYAISSMIAGILIGMFVNFSDPDRVYDGFFNLLFRGFLSVLMLVMGLEAWARLNELRKVAQWYVLYSIVAPLLHGFIGFGFGMIAHYLFGFSIGGAAVLAVIACSSSDISGPPTLRAGIPSANPSAYIGSSTAIGTPVAIGIGIPIYVSLAQALLRG